jgi:hypothetical protein
MKSSMVDFTVTTFRNFLTELQNANYSFQTVAAFLRSPEKRTVILRHDVDHRVENARTLARIEHELCLEGTFYFRTIKDVFIPKIIREIAYNGHEIGYHYEEMDICQGNINAAINLFEGNLSRFRSICPVETICMHGSPRSRYDNRDLWKAFDYHKYGIIGEPYFDIDFNCVQYLTDTGRRWNGTKFSIRDKISDEERQIAEMRFQSTRDIIDAIRTQQLKDQILITIHPQRWTNSWGAWLKELIWQNVKNWGKWAVIKKRRNYPLRRSNRP